MKILVLQDAPPLMSCSEAPQPKRRKIRCGHCGEEGHNETSCLRNAQASSRNHQQPANIQPSKTHGHNKVSRRWRDIYW